MHYTFVDSNVEKLVRERFGKALSRGITDLRIKRATHSPISGLIDNAVIEVNMFNVLPYYCCCKHLLIEDIGSYCSRISKLIAA